MENTRKSRKNTAQNIIIALLLVSALFLLYQLQSLSRSGGYLSLFSDTTVSSPSVEQAANLPALPAPVRLAVTGAYGRWANLGLTTTDESFASPGNLLREALGSAGSPQACQESDFRAALSGESIYYDFDTVLPLSVLAGFVGADAPAEQSARRLLLSVEGESVALFLTNDTSYSRCSTKVAPEDLKTLIGGYQLGGAAFSFELEENALAPYSLFLTEEQPEYPTLTAETASGDTEAVLSAFGFTPHTKSRYMDNGTLVVMEGDRTLRLQPDGTVIYESGGTADLLIAAAGEQPTAQEAALGCFQILNQLPSGDAALYLQSLQSDGPGGWALSFDYQINGVPIRRSSGEPAATVHLQGSKISSLTFSLRQYAAGESFSLLLPLTQAFAIAQSYPGKELHICYTDTGADTLSASWLAE